MECAKAFSPGHVTGLFSIHEDEDPLRQGSLGAGFSLTEGVTASVDLETDREDRFILNGNVSADLPVSRAVVRIFYEKIGEKRSKTIKAVLETSLPIGCGFGTSGAGALALAVALNALHGDPLSFLEAAQIAHLAEIELSTGLGTVIGEAFGGFEIRVESGAPGVGKLKPFGFPEKLRAVFLVFGPLPTAGMLRDPVLRENINAAGDSLRQKLQGRPSVEKFLELSLEFSSRTGMVGPRLKSLQDALSRQGWDAPMLMFGEGLFTLVQEETLEKTLGAFRALGGGRVFSCGIDSQGVRVLDVH